MTQLLTDGMQNVYTPFPFTMHLVFCLIATFVYGAQFVRRGSKHYLLLLLAVDATFITQLCTTSIIITFLFILEVLLLAAALVFSIKFNKQQKLKEEMKAAKAEKRINDNSESDEI